ncbi:ATP-binding cassette, subfamily C [Jatrophihabitans endophyticus]|uniref:ATP-binding cassette, subfamily C n=1 Tax=Jatrophihabitans endophyticus TaxID=1206085 RepID=A0A1M5EI83_9ACTN|nr:ABC transporter ATP-binding protein [Jatrophihabitans endophyticus]SHF78876.1 ATP-binding cassette, subfamily C [Jatrophihabitans endophyticus]
MTAVVADRDATGEPVGTARDILRIAPAGETARLTWRLLRRRPGALVVTVLAFAGTGLAALVAPWVLGLVVDAVREHRDTATITRYAVVVAAAALLGGVLTAVSTAALARATAPALAELREDVLDRAVHLDTARLEAAGAGDVLSRVGDDVRTVTTSLNDVVPQLISSLVVTAFTGVGLVALDWRLGLAGLAAAPCYALALRWYLGRSGALYARQRVAQGERAEALVAGIHGAPTLRAFGREDAQLARVRHHSRHAADLAVEVFTVMMRFGGRCNASELAGLVLVLGAGFLLVRAGAGTVGEATAAALYFHRLFNPISGLLFAFDEIQSSGASLARMAGVASLTTARRSADVPAHDAPLRLLGVGHSYVDGIAVLRDIDLVVAPGEHVAVVGATGAGKTTLGAIAAGQLTPTRGEVRLGDVAAAGIDEQVMRRHICVVSQELHVFAGTLAENLRLARPAATAVELRAALERVGALGWADALTDGLDTVVGEHGAPLTPARTQQLALARVVLADPPAVVLDEATAEAGSSGARQLEIAALATIAGRTAIVVAHRLTQAAACDRVLVLDAGRVVEEGSHDELVAAGGAYARLWGAWSGTDGTDGTDPPR